MQPIKIIRGTTNVVVYTNGNSLVPKFLHRELSVFEFNPRTKRSKLKYTYYRFNWKKNIGSFPINYYDKFMKYVRENNIPVVEKQGPSYNVSKMQYIKMNEKFKPRENQIPALDYLMDGKNSRKGLALNTGLGKTFCATHSMVSLNEVSMVLVSGMVQQWVSSIVEQTNLLDDPAIAKAYADLTSTEINAMKFAKGANSIFGDKLYVIQGAESLTKLFKSELKPDIFVCSLETIREYSRGHGGYADFPKFSEFIKYFGIGVKVVDEAHLNFHANMMIDLTFNIKTNIYLTATFDSSDKQIKRIFDVVFPPDMRFGDGTFEKRVNVTCYGHHGGVPEKKALSPMGYSHSKYETYILKNKEVLVDYLERVISPPINVHYINKAPNGRMKLLIFCSKVEMIQEMVMFFQTKFPNKKVVPYTMHDPDINLVDGEIIVSTMKSAGTGRDIKDLFCVLNTVSFKAITQVRQAFGRLRKLKCGTHTEYVEIIDIALRSQIRHWHERKFIMQPRSLTYREFIVE